ncbi:hypothetical protein ZHAS_00015870 [Anopheles sinensis]|uniref:Uncharacterized protein n=1 Tax=Anopheles sinensis TaxID=74873 RepID=A0A084WC52_ANOSI|nr:hypothetical protein ZHAS_00015870 [Anopheles sinensis]
MATISNINSSMTRAYPGAAWTQPPDGVKPRSRDLGAESIIRRRLSTVPSRWAGGGP